MAGVTIEELGFQFVQSCAKEYWGSCMFLFLFAAGILWSLFCHKKQISRIFVCYTVFLCLTVYNPVLVKYIIPKINFENEYYRFFWILPVIPGIAYYAVRIVFSMKRTGMKIAAALLCAAVIILAGSPMQGIVQGFSMTENLYKVPNDLRAVCAVIHQDSTKENPKVVFDMELNFAARQYDASLLLTLERDAVLYRSGSEVISVNPKTRRYRRQKVIMDVVYYNKKVKSATFAKVLAATETDYLVIPISYPNHDYLRNSGCVPVAQTEEHIVYRFEWESIRKSGYIRKSEPVEPSAASVSGQYNTYERLSIPTCITKIDDTYFISDCYHNQIIYSDSLKAPLTEWKIMADNLNYGHTLASDGTVYLADDTDNHSILVYEKQGDDFRLTQKFSSIGNRPHFVVYDESTLRFYALSSMTGELYVFKRLDNSTEVVLEEVRSMEELSESYIRSFTIMGDEIYFVSGPNAIVRARLSDLTLLEEYPVGPELSGMIQMEKIQDWYYITISTDIDGNQDAATIIRTQDLHGLINGDYEDIYSLFGGGGTPYYMTTFDGHWYLTEHRKGRGLWQFDVTDNEITNIELLY